VVKLPAGSGTPTVLPFTGLNWPGGVAVDSAGNLYVTDFGNNRVVKLPAG
jgi:serine/threonine protein kinase, bacterial